MSITLDKVNQILAEKQAKIIPENIRKDVQIFDVVGLLDDSTKLYKSESEIPDVFSGNVKPEDIAIVMEDIQPYWDPFLYSDTTAFVNPTFKAYNSGDINYTATVTYTSLVKITVTVTIIKTSTELSFNYTSSGFTSSNDTYKWTSTDGLTYNFHSKTDKSGVVTTEPSKISMNSYIVSQFRDDWMEGPYILRWALFTGVKRTITKAKRCVVASNGAALSSDFYSYTYDLEKCAIDADTLTITPAYHKEKMLYADYSSVTSQIANNTTDAIITLVDDGGIKYAIPYRAEIVYDASTGKWYVGTVKAGLTAYKDDNGSVTSFTPAEYALVPQAYGWTSGTKVYKYVEVSNKARIAEFYGNTSGGKNSYGPTMMVVKALNTEYVSYFDQDYMINLTWKELDLPKNTTGVETTAKASDILQGKMAVSRGATLYGTIPTYDLAEFTPSTEEIIIPTGYYSNSKILGANISDNNAVLFDTLEEMENDTITGNREKYTPGGVYFKGWEKVTGANKIVNTVKFPSEIVLDTPVTTDVTGMFVCQNNLESEWNFSITLSPTSYKASRSGLTIVAYTSTDGLTYTRTSINNTTGNDIYTFDLQDGWTTNWTDNVLDNFIYEESIKFTHVGVWDNVDMIQILDMPTLNGTEIKWHTYTKYNDLDELGQYIKDNALVSLTTSHRYIYLEDKGNNVFELHVPSGPSNSLRFIDGLVKVEGSSSNEKYTIDMNTRTHTVGTSVASIELTEDTHWNIVGYFPEKTGKNHYFMQEAPLVSIGSSNLDRKAVTIPTLGWNITQIIEDVVMTQEEYERCNMIADNVLQRGINYTGLEYIDGIPEQISGKLALIRLDVAPANTIMFRTKLTRLHNGAQTIIGDGTGVEERQFKIFYYEGQYLLDYGSGYNLDRIFGGEFPLNTPVELEVGNRYIKDLTTNTMIVEAEPTAPFAYAELNVSVRECRVYYIQIYETQTGTLIKDFIPVKRYDGRIGLVDRVSGRFHDVIGEWVAGPALN